MKLKPDFAEGHSNLGNALQQAGKLDDAIASWRRALAIRPQLAETQSNLGMGLLEQCNLEEAEVHLRQAILLQPNFPDARFNLGGLLKDRGQLDEAVACYRELLRIKPDYVGGYVNLGVALNTQGKSTEAIACYEQALWLDPNHDEALGNLAQALRDLGRVDEALAAAQQAVSAMPANPKAHMGLGVLWSRLGKPDQAIVCYEQALRLKPDYADAHYALAMALLCTGQWEQGLVEYEWRWRTKGYIPPRFPKPLWDGSPLAGRTLLLLTEQGLGDILQFIRFAAAAKQTGGTVVVSCRPALIRLLESCPGIDRLIPAGEMFTEFDVYVSLFSLPRLLKIPLAAVSPQVPYVFADPQLVELWRQKLQAWSGFKIGIAWQGSSTYPDDRQRSLPLAQFEPIAAIPGVQLFSLQQGYGTEQLRPLADRLPVNLLGDDLDRAAGTFMDTAAVMKNLDLVITSDTSIAHLAGALGVAVWLATPLANDWRWLQRREDSPWYPTMRLFRQRSLGNWQTVFESMAAALRAIVESNASTPPQNI